MTSAGLEILHGETASKYAARSEDFRRALRSRSSHGREDSRRSSKSLPSGDSRNSSQSPVRATKRVSLSVFGLRGRESAFQVEGEEVFLGPAGQKIVSSDRGFLLLRVPQKVENGAEFPQNPRAEHVERVVFVEPDKRPVVPAGGVPVGNRKLRARVFGTKTAAHHREPVDADVFRDPGAGAKGEFPRVLLENRFARPYAFSRFSQRPEGGAEGLFLPPLGGVPAGLGIRSVRRKTPDFREEERCGLKHDHEVAEPASVFSRGAAAPVLDEGDTGKSVGRGIFPEAGRFVSGFGIFSGDLRFFGFRHWGCLSGPENCIRILVRGKRNFGDFSFSLNCKVFLYGCRSVILKIQRQAANTSFRRHGGSDKSRTAFCVTITRQEVLESKEPEE